ncbi:hypothetical protein [Actinomadura coerulea]|uniref:hypothetical protein n=1 Tax=Actinomadura coerulea TaxID=46159 RepID=UPI003434143A
MFGIFKRRREDELAEIEAEITAFGEELARLPLDPDEHGADLDLMADYGRALDAYEQAKLDFLGDRDRGDAADVLRSLDQGRRALARVRAVLTGRPLCFFDPRHGPSVDCVTWAPPGGAARDVHVCAADAIRLIEGLPPIATGIRPETRTEWAGGTGDTRRPREPKQAPRPPLPPRPAKRPGPFKVAPPDLGDEHHVKGRGKGEVLLHRPNWEVPSLVVVRLHESGRIERVQGGKAVRLADEPLPFRIVKPLSLQTDWPVQLRVGCYGTWSAWLQAGDTVPVIERTVASRGPFICRYAGGAARIEMQHREGGKYSVTELTPEFHQGPRVLSGKGISSAEGQVAGSVFLHVEAKGEWVIKVIHRTS